MEAGLRTSRSSGCCERQTQELQRAICAVAMGSHPRPSTKQRSTVSSEPVLPEFDLATYRAIDGELGRYELEWFS